MGDLFAPERICPVRAGGAEVPVSATSETVWKPEQPKEAEKVINVPALVRFRLRPVSFERETDVLRLNRNQRHQGSR